MAHGPPAGGNFKDAAINFTAGSLGGIAATYVGQPLDTVKVKMQTFPHLYSNMVDCIRKTVVREGFFRGLYAGTAPAIAANVAENSVLFAAYGGCQKVMQFVTNAESVESMSVLSNATAGFLAAFFSTFTLCPTELIKCKLQAAREAVLAGTDSGTMKLGIGPFRLTQGILEKEGIRGLFRGLDSTMIREMPGYFVFFGGYELTRELLAPPGGSKEDVGALGTMAAGAVGGMALWTVVFPADVVKSRTQIQGITGNMFSIMYSIWRREGIFALYHGLGPTLIRTIPATAALFLTVETTKKMLRSSSS